VAEHESVWSDLQGVPFVQGYLDAGGVRTRYLHAGDESKPPLILLHGSGGHAEAYVRNLEAHAEHFSTWSIDMLGHGYTDKPGHPLEIRHYLDHLFAFMAAIGVDRANLSGAGTHQVVDGRQIKGLRRPGRQPATGISPAGLCRRDE
jgi:2-hydroxy-6-oxonona-2,4-dienedioate hydrolase